MAVNQSQSIYSVAPPIFRENSLVTCLSIFLEFRICYTPGKRIYIINDGCLVS